MKKNKYCHWELEDEDSNAYNTECKDCFYLTEGTPEENHIKFCPFCGSIISLGEQTKKGER